MSLESRSPASGSGDAELPLSCDALWPAPAALPPRSRLKIDGSDDERAAEELPPVLLRRKRKLSEIGLEIACRPHIHQVDVAFTPWKRWIRGFHGFEKSIEVGFKTIQSIVNMKKYNRLH